ncbi:MaoC family dehydratase N-terminal domain-containing protein [Myxococcaceae bacterium JPH2]|nr:MaoC family dehydratase N-terminal domain-containing protein [Myxococcaceae bacterium JPH2]
MDSDLEFNAIIDEFLERTRPLIGLESTEDVPPPIPPALPEQVSPVPAALVLDEETIRRYAHSIGDDNPLFTDPAYGHASHHRSMIAPTPILVHARYPADHGASRPHGYPFANFIGGLAWEFFDVVRPGTRVTTSKVLREVQEVRGLDGHRLILLVCEVTYQDAFGRLLAKAYGTLVQVPMKMMGHTRAMPVEHVGEHLLNTRQTHRYTQTEVEAIVAGMRSERRRGKEPLYWEDVAVGDALPAIYQPPYTLQDALCYQSLHQGLVAGYGGGRLARSFTPGYRVLKAGWGYPDFARVHPVTRWPYTPGDEHEDALLCTYRGQPLPFDFGIQRAQIPQRLLTNWAGDMGFSRKMFMLMGRPLFHGDALIVRGAVTAKSTVTEPGSRQPHHSVRVTMEAFNQRGESVSRGFATVYLPSRATGEAPQPIRPASPPPYVPYDQHRSPAWY